MSTAPICDYATQGIELRFIDDGNPQDFKEIPQPADAAHERSPAPGGGELFTSSVL